MFSLVVNFSVPLNLQPFSFCPTSSAVNSSAPVHPPLLSSNMVDHSLYPGPSQLSTTPMYNNPSVLLLSCVRDLGTSGLSEGDLFQLISHPLLSSDEDSLFIDISLTPMIDLGVSGLRRPIYTTKSYTLSCFIKSYFTYYSLSTITRILTDIITTGSMQAVHFFAREETLSRTIANTINYLNLIYQVFASIQENNTYMFEKAINQTNKNCFVHI